MSASSPYNVLNQLRRYKRLLVFGGGAVTTLMLLIAFILAMLSAVRAHVAVERRTFVVSHNQIMEQIRVGEASFRIALVGAELAWPNGTKVDQALVDEFRKHDGGIVLQPTSAERPQRVFAVNASALRDDEIRRYLVLAEQLSRSRAIHSLARGRQLPGYFYGIEYDIAGIMSSSLDGEPWPATAVAADRERLIAALANGLTRLADTPPGTPAQPYRQLFWIPPAVSPLTGKLTIRLAAPLLHNGTPFAMLATEYEPDFLIAPLIGDEHSDGAYMIVAGDGTIINSTIPQARAETLLDQRTLALTKKGGETWHDGMFTIAGPLGDTGWTLVHTCTWRDIVAGIGLHLGIGAAMTLLTLVAAWTFLMSFKNRAVRPALDRSQRLFESEQLSRTLIETAPVGLGLIALKDGTPLLRSPIMIKAAKRVVMPAPTLSAELAARYRARAQSGAHDSDEVMHEELTLPTHDSDSIDVALSATPSRYQGEDVLVVTVTDVTAHKRLEQHLREARQAADCANAAKSAFLATMSHEIRTPLNAVLGNLELLAQSPLDALQRDRLTTIRTSSEGLLAIISDVLDFSKIEADEMTLEHIEFDALDVVARSLTMFAPLAQSKDLQLVADLGVAASQPMLGDPTRLGQIINNLLSNAIKFTERGAVTLRVSVPDMSTPGGLDLQIEVEDTGIGMSARQQAAIFQPFSQADTSINRRFGGTGLGLAQAMGGSIAMRSEPGNGSCFTVRVPLGAPQAAPDMPQFAGESVTLVAAAEASRAYAVSVLQAWGLTVNAYPHLAQADQPTLTKTRTLILLGERDTWHVDGESHLIERASWVIDCTAAGPVNPVASGRVVRVSSFSLMGLAQALQHTLRDVPLAWTKDTPQVLPHRLRVLAAEDNAVNRRLLEEQLTMLGCDATVVEDGARALAWLSRETFDVLVTDLSMPLIDGYTLAREVHQRWPHMPVIAATASVTSEERERCEAAGIARMVTKPLSLARLRAILTEVAGMPAAVSQIAYRTEAQTGSQADSQPEAQVEIGTQTNDTDDALLGGRALPAELRQMFNDSFDTSLTAIATAQRDNNAPCVLAELHSLRGALGVLRQYELADLCAAFEIRIEQAGLAGLGSLDIAACLRDTQESELTHE
ncbi:hybrid sensor histidine kinase/response regulator [Paraburkholderia susongensis]|uniref:Sensory/regulatory protein RpfC n=1 Tax=Paraburkholderia susongensis TaxID=1515439 RepID=A0A1X7LK98_9BURK|nr:hybrid sensor histidine kinase/response regulator [Paraburkholderia susongensis]SMG54308.1 two-component system, NarL family, capsular synthesis sensor histidine kinase RcsC [Paraburkholderia susongensis]